MRVEYSDRTADNNLRHAVFQGLKEPELNRASPKAQKRYITDEQLASVWVTNPGPADVLQGRADQARPRGLLRGVGDTMLPHILNRPVSLIRCPTGEAKDCFFQRHAFSGMPQEIGIFPAPKIGQGPATTTSS